MSSSFPAFVVRKAEDGAVTTSVETLTLDDLPAGEILIRVVYSSLNYKDAMACGLVGGVQLRTTVYPFLSRGVHLAGIDSAKCPVDRRLEMWRRLSGQWKIASLDSLANTIPLDELPVADSQILAGAIEGRTLVQPVVAGQGGAP